MDNNRRVKRKYNCVYTVVDAVFLCWEEGKEGYLISVLRESDTVKLSNFVSFSFEEDMCAICMPG